MNAKTYDLVTIGGGLAGAAIARTMAVAGARVLVLEDNAIPGEGITVNTGGIIRVAYSNLDVARVATFARAIYREPARRLGLSVPTSMGFVPTGWGRFVNADAVPGVVGDAASVEADSFTRGLLDHPQYTRPAVVHGRAVPPVLLSGHHGEIERWRRVERVRRTLARRPDLIRRDELDADERRELDRLTGGPGGTAPHETEKERKT